MRIETVQITPEQAAQWLAEYNHGNRPLRQRRVDTYARMIERGQWLITGDPIRFDPDHRLIDGQHRLAAIAQSGMAATAVVIWNVPTEAFKVIDSGLARTGGDALGVTTTSATLKAAVCRVLWVVDAGGDPRMSSDLALADYYEANAPMVDTSAAFASSFNAQFRTSNRTAAASFHFLISRAASRWVDEFMHGLRSGANLGAGDPRLALRNWFANDRDLKNAGRHLGLYVKTWNAWMNGETRQLAVIRPDEGFPSVVDKRRARPGGDIIDERE